VGEDLNEVGDGKKGRHRSKRVRRGHSVGTMPGGVQWKTRRRCGRICLPAPAEGLSSIFSPLPNMDFKARALAALRTQRPQTGPRHAVVGLDGFVDTIVKPVGQRSGQGDAFTPIKTIPEFAQRILGAAGKSTNV